MVERLLTSSEGAVILATSREPLRIPAERVFLVDSLAPRTPPSNRPAEGRGGGSTEGLDGASAIPRV